MADPQRILVRLPNPLGDVVMSTPVLRALRRAHPQAELVAQGLPHHEGLLRGNPHLDAFLPVRGRRPRDIWRRARTLRKHGFDWAVVLPDSPRTALEPWLARIPRRAGYARDWLRRALVTEWLPPPRENGRRVALSMIERYYRITRLFGVPDAGSALELFVHAPERERVAAWLAARGASDALLCLVTPGAAFGASKLWPPAHFARACDEIARRFSLLPLILPAPNADEIAIARDVASRMAERHLLVAEPGDLEDLKAFVERAALLVGNDTGPRHVAVALGRPVVTLMGPTDPRHTDHLLERQRVLREPVACSPCGLPVCPIDHRCMTRLAPERVVAAAAELLART
ncbi:MAG TPA: lipopolysaccharide heptosyltransferase II [Myxococcota bacterium]|nr:lipopolysaccharide heptosyltransferase II [Myxococcota bacterium]